MNIAIIIVVFISGFMSTTFGQLKINDRVKHDIPDANLFKWEHASPESEGVSSETLLRLCECLKEKNTKKLFPARRAIQRSKK